MEAHRLREPIELKGVGVHSGAGVSLVVGPGEDGIVFRRADTGGTVRADWRNVAATRLQTVVQENGAAVKTIEHLMSALAAFGVRDATVSIDGPEVPIMDGSAAPFVEAIRPAIEPAPAGEAIRVMRPVAVRSRDAFAAFLPFDGRRFDVCIDFPDAIIGVQRLAFDLTAEGFAREIAPARTFGRLRDVEMLHRKGFAKGASLENAVAVDGATVANPEGLRFPDEFVRHKLLDAIGDTALAGKPILGLYRSHKGGHRLNYELLRALFADAENVQIVA
ncbi:UDP-3-O-acyl-N-acetylglucosamine deacetylase [Acuticoccus kalidii]|uniref:UDP-3-O-acyl-N-acetylglucosamine deacetylase n=1 Tax=Acuticoccus kalidii TaxID=2910977 RepID=UPI0034E2723A